MVTTNNTNLDSVPKTKKGFSDQENTEQKRKTLGARFSELLHRSLLNHPKFIWAGWMIAALAFLSVLPVAYVCWFIFIPELWGWTFEAWWHFLPAAFGFLFLFVMPIWAAMIAGSISNVLLDITLEAEDPEVVKARQTARESEEVAIQRFSGTDTGDLLELLKNSRTDLEAYYTIGLNQSKRSFRHGVLAMWLGFILLLIGITMYIAPVEQLNITRPDPANFNILVIGGSAIIEFVSALFLWVYRSTSIQLNNLYNREMHNHSVVICYKIASTIKDSDDSKRAIIDKVLGREWSYQIPEPTGAKGMRDLITPGVSKSKESS